LAHLGGFGMSEVLGCANRWPAAVLKGSFIDPSGLLLLEPK
jgi:hypothetical protein